MWCKILQYIDCVSHILRRYIYFRRFGKSDVFGKAKKAVPKPSHIKGSYRNSCFAPKLVDQTGRPSVESDKHSLDYLINTASGL